jgi:hypothetical protein
MAKRKAKRPAKRATKAAKKPRPVKAKAAKTAKTLKKSQYSKTKSVKKPAKAAKKPKPTKAVKKPVASTPSSVETTRTRWATRNYVGVRLFAGAPNPRWTMPDNDFREIEHALLHLPPRTEAANRLAPNSLYGGMVVHLVHANGSRRGFLVHDEHVFDSASEVVRLDAGRKIEEHLFGTMPVNLNESLKNLTFEAAKARVNEEFGVVGAEPGEEPPCCDGGPSFLAPPPKSEWDRFPGIEDNNCYNYSNNEFSEIDDAQPGRRDFNPLTEEEMHRLLLRDRLVPVAPDRKQLPEACLSTDGANLLAVCLRAPDGTKNVKGVAVTVYSDYHCFRLDANGRWSHKDGSNPSTNEDNGGKPLIDLAAGAFKIEHVLVGYYWSIPGQRLIGMPR